ncbi:hypothetical protein [Glaciecola petra]|uniref:Uncharacterized protein n=1 Tax=Glaciecola petra TaxID=3075602 RepID=A0ABU2ZTU6_9ALTE|nr:hypothetical protein [Aestuariibacter sp. P117]MDT0594994.1 hypothetical protein [Aestuariibacter sp. P117]
MNIDLWGFLTVAVLAGIGFLVMIIITGNQRKMKELEVEALKVQNVNLKNAVEDAVLRHIKDQNTRIEVLEAIVTDKKYDLNQKITNLK